MGREQFLQTRAGNWSRVAMGSSLVLDRKVPLALISGRSASNRDQDGRLKEGLFP
jgi:hypothetical protein